MIVYLTKYGEIRARVTAVPGEGDTNSSSNRDQTVTAMSVDI